LESIRIKQTCLNNFDWKAIKPAQAFARRADETADREASLEQELHRMAPDEPGPTRDKRARYTTSWKENAGFVDFLLLMEYIQKSFDKQNRAILTFSFFSSHWSSIGSL
jgi:hypothetical protein